MNAEAKLLRLERRFMVLVLLMVVQMAGTLVFWSAGPVTGAAPRPVQARRGPAVAPGVGLSWANPVPKAYVTDMYVKTLTVDQKINTSLNVRRWQSRDANSDRQMGVRYNLP